MIDLSIDFDDVRSHIKLSDTGIRVGRSHVDIYQHRLVEGLIYFNDRKIVAVSRECSSGDDHVTSAIRLEEVATDHELDAIHKEIKSTRLAVVTVEIGRSTDNPYVLIYNNHNPLTSLCLCLEEARVIASWNFMTVARRSNRNIISDDFLARWLTLQPHQYNNGTIFKNIHRTTINTETLVTRDKIRISEVDLRVSTYPRQLRTPERAQEFLFQMLTETLTRRRFEFGKMAVEVSGGLDSSVVAVAAAAVLPHPIAASIDVATDSQNQTTRQELLARKLGLDHVKVDVWAHLPFAAGTERFASLGTSYLAESFYEAFHHLTQILKTRGIDAILTGMGGDEAFPLFADEVDTSRAVKPRARPSFIRPKAYLLAELPPVTRNFITSYHGSAALGVANRAERFLNQGIWPVNPFLEPEIIQFGSSLPPALRHQRAILSNILAGNGMPEFLDGKPMSFEPTIPHVAKGIRDLLQQLLAESVCSELGLLDPVDLWSTYEELVNKEDMDELDELYFVHILFFLQVESFLDMCRKNGITEIYT
ncbi:asparagine synthase-related protein [Rhizobium leguminosarum]|uniref:asparagine synthase-related protein n=1 Tax=Rhizobium leguminosarum TaxID=384 RepID=UPI00144140AE|nr:asparagine synthase-related protein [Rhizobium leguminosarum]MBY5427858.1 hypothetical protein [Rhizobium leguminosarum]NKL87367.1 hypothetical protein [Rhizobium leguminosarum bv. viciae]